MTEIQTQSLLKNHQWYWCRWWFFAGDQRGGTFSCIL